MLGLSWLQDVRPGSEAHCTRLQDSPGSAMSEAAREFDRRVGQIHLHSGKDSNLHLEAALRELLCDRAMNYGSSHGQVTLAPSLPKRQGFPPSRLEISEVEEMVSARGRPHTPSSVGFQL